VVKHVERLDLLSQALDLRLGQTPLGQLRPRDVEQAVPVRADAGEDVLDIEHLVAVAFWVIGVGAKESGKRKDEDATGGEVVENGFQLVELTRLRLADVIVPDIRRVPPTAPALYVTVQIMATDRQHVVALALSPVEKRHALGLGPI